MPTIQTRCKRENTKGTKKKKGTMQSKCIKYLCNTSRSLGEDGPGETPEADLHADPFQQPDGGKHKRALQKFTMRGSF